MTQLSYSCPIPDAQASRLLQAWVCGDVDGLETTLDHIANSRVRPMDVKENTRFKLLKVIARGLKACPDRYAPASANPVLGLYVDLLSLLSDAGQVQ